MKHGTESYSSSSSGGTIKSGNLMDLPSLIESLMTTTAGFLRSILLLVDPHLRFFQTTLERSSAINADSLIKSKSRLRTDKNEETSLSWEKWASSGHKVSMPSFVKLEAYFSTCSQPPQSLIASTTPGHSSNWHTKSLALPPVTVISTSLTSDKISSNSLLLIDKMGSYLLNCFSDAALLQNDFMKVLDSVPLLICTLFNK
mmetsp:Transcript_29904/g.36411  ORF Transcript_29904/g.36411 Transcript_29904/m.36411 type:complete len:201 (-) Transcript_29904:1886-2488(-)